MTGFYVVSEIAQILDINLNFCAANSGDVKEAPDNSNSGTEGQE